SPDSVDSGPRASDFRSDVHPASLFLRPIRTVIRTEIASTTRKSLILHAPRVTRTPALLIRSHRTRRVDTLIRGVSRGDALANVTMRGLATPQSGHTSEQDAR